MENILEIIYADKRFAEIRHHLLRHGVTTVGDLSEFDFDELALLPGVSEADAMSAREVFLLAQRNEANASDNDINRSSSELDRLPISMRAKNRLASAKIYSLSELYSLSEAELRGIYYIGAKTCREILEYVQANPLAVSETEAKRKIAEIDESNKSIPISLLTNIGSIQREIKRLIDKGVSTVGDLCDYDITPSEYDYIKLAIGDLSIPATSLFVRSVESLKPSAKICFKKRLEGATLQEIGNELKITREGVRQIITRSLPQLLKYAELVAGMILSTHNESFVYADLLAVFADEQMTQLCKFVLSESEYVTYISISEKFVRSDLCPEDYRKEFSTFIAENIVDGMNFYDNLDLLESELGKRSLGFVSSDDVFNYLVQNGYRFYGDFVSKYKRTYGFVLSEIVSKHFSFDIKLDSAEDNEDMKMYRDIVARHYPRLELPESNRALATAITSDGSNLVLSGRGRYCPIDKVVYSMDIFDDVYQYIQNSPQPSMYYYEVYAHFEERFLSESNINNYQFLHGMLKHLFPSDFKYERNIIVKDLSMRNDVYARMTMILKEYGRPMTKADLRKAIPGIGNFSITNSKVRLNDVILWDINEFCHIDFLKVTDDDVALLRQTLTECTDKHSGYCSDFLLYASMQDKHPGFLDKNSIKNPRNLYFVADHFLNGEFRFTRPHISTISFPVKDLTAINIARELLKPKDSLNSLELVELAEKFGWVIGTIPRMLMETEKDNIRISEFEYVNKDRLSFSADEVEQLSKLLRSLLEPDGYCVLRNISDYGAFPSCGFQWNDFLLESVIMEYQTEFRVIYPQARNRRYQQGIITASDGPYDSFCSLVAELLKQNDIQSISEHNLIKFLRSRGINITTLPQELYNSSNIYAKDAMFHVC